MNKIKSLKDCDNVHVSNAKLFYHNLSLYLIDSAQKSLYLNNIDKLVSSSKQDYQQCVQSFGKCFEYSLDYRELSTQSNDDFDYINYLKLLYTLGDHLNMTDPLDSKLLAFIQQGIEENKNITTIDCAGEVAKIYYKEIVDSILNS